MQGGVCQKCRKRKTCKAPCAPVELYLREDNLTAFQKNAIGKHGEEIRIAMPRSRETQRSCLSGGDGDPRTSSKEAQAFSTENGNPFMSYEPNHKQTSVFIKRFFGKWSYEDIAKAHDLKTASAAMKLYHAAAKRLLAVIVEMDSIHKMTETERKKADVVKQKRYLEKNREKVNARRRAHYQKNKERINSKRREQYSKRSKPDTI
jgi:hypothetical protein